MKLILLFFTMLLISISLYAKRISKHEIGIGIGYMEYNIYGEGKSNEVRRSKIAFSPGRDEFEYYGNEFYQLSSTTPCFYYSNQLDKRLQFRFSFQLSYAKSTSNEGEFGFSPHAEHYVSISKVRNYDLNVGFYRTLIQQQIASISLGFGFNLNPIFIKEKTSYLNTSLEKSQEILGMAMPFSSLSFCFVLDQNINFKYDIACMTNLESLYLQPFNRLSLNFGL